MPLIDAIPTITATSNNPPSLLKHITSFVSTINTAMALYLSSTAATTAFRDGNCSQKCAFNIVATDIICSKRV